MCIKHAFIVNESKRTTSHKIITITLSIYITFSFGNLKSLQKMFQYSLQHPCALCPVLEEVPKVFNIVNPPM